MAGPKAERVVAEFVQQYPDACVEALTDVRMRLNRVEAAKGDVPENQVTDAESYLRKDASTHKAGASYMGRGGRVGDTPG